ncbi:MAG: hypothetical protein GY800_09395 [Planctomycetes bacterium]|nr:hypothetical protein [Planctomycetota bacterium]
MVQEHTAKGHPDEHSHPHRNGGATRAGSRHSLYRYLLLFCLFSSVLPFIVINTITYVITRGVIKEKSFNQLVSIRDIKKTELEDYFFERRADAFQLTNNSVFKSVARAYSEAFNKGGLSGAAYEDVDHKFGGVLVSFAEAYKYYDVMIMDMNGDIVASAKGRPELGKNVLKKPFAGTPLEKTFVRGKTGIDILDMRWYAPGGHPAMFMSAPITEDITDTTVAVIVFHMDNKKINDIMTQRSGLEKTGESYLVGQDFILRSDSRFIKGPSVLKTGADTSAVREALAGNTDTGIIRDYRDIKVLSAFAPLNVTYSVRWALVVEMDKREALTMKRSVKEQFMYICASLVLVWLIVILVFHQLMARRFLKRERHD